jgi:hypothetical protein
VERRHENELLIITAPSHAKQQHIHLQKRPRAMLQIAAQGLFIYFPTSLSFIAEREKFLEKAYSKVK